MDEDLVGCEIQVNQEHARNLHPEGGKVTQPLHGIHFRLDERVEVEVTGVIAVHDVALLAMDDLKGVDRVVVADFKRSYRSH